MNKTRLPMLIVMVSLVAVIGTAILTFQRTTRVEGSNRAVPAGMGDLRLHESNPDLPGTGGAGSLEKSRPAVVGIGDLRLYESTQSASPPTGGKPQTLPNEGISFEKQGAGASASALRELDCPTPVGK